MGYDPKAALQIVPYLVDAGVPCTEVRQGWITMAPATKLLTRWIEQKAFNHLNNPVLAWMAANAELRQASLSTADNRMIVKDPDKRHKKIDGIVSNLCAIARIIDRQEVGSYLSETEGEIFFV